MKKKFTWRKLFNDIHLWLGLASGLVLFTVCLTGTIFTFHTEIEEMLEPKKYQVQVPAQAGALSPDVLVAQLEQAQKGKVTALQIPHNPAKPYRLTLKKPENDVSADAQKSQSSVPVAADPKGGKGVAGGGVRGTVYLVNQYTGELQGTTESNAKELFHSVEQLHRSLLVKSEPGQLNPGKIIVGASTIMFIFIILTGLWIWFPKKIRNWRQGLKVKFSGNWKRITHDLHYSLGFYSSFLLLIMALTGLCWSFDWYREGASAVLGDQVFKQRAEKPMLSTYSSAPTISVSKVIQISDGLLPEAGSYRISLPMDSAAAVVVSKNQAGFFAFSGSDKVQLDQYTGQVLKLEKFSDKKFNEKVAASVKGLHVGDVFGTFSKIIYFLACLLATSLPVTGTLMWFNKKQKKNRKEKAAAARVLSQV